MHAQKRIAVVQHRRPLLHFKFYFLVMQQTKNISRYVAKHVARKLSAFVFGANQCRNSTKFIYLLHGLGFIFLSLKTHGTRKIASTSKTVD